MFIAFFIPGNSLNIKLLTKPAGKIVIIASPTTRFSVVCVGFVVCDSFNELDLLRMTR